MHVDVQRTVASSARSAADWLAAVVGSRPAAVLALPTGRTPLPLYRRLVRLNRTGAIDLRRVHVFNLDEFAGLGPRHAASFARYLTRHLLGVLSLPQAQVHLLRGDAPDLVEEARRCERDLARCGGLDAAIIGIGRNGHVGFNEPARALEADTHVARLSLSTRQAYAPMFGDTIGAVPATSLTMGIGTILRARRLLLLATGPEKASIVARALEGPVRTDVPASLLQLHPDLTVVLDRAAAGVLAPRRPVRRADRPRQRHR
jgi:glucosamine-6-phosphate deaminase